MNSKTLLRPLQKLKKIPKSSYTITKTVITQAKQRDNAVLDDNLEETSDIFSNSSPTFIKRIDELKAGSALQWPRLESHQSTLTIREFCERWKHLAPKEYAKEDGSFCIRGKLLACRVMGTRLIFIDLMQEGETVQVKANLSALSKTSEVSERDFQRLYHLLQRGDYISVVGHAHRTEAGQITVMADTLPEIISPSLACLPRSLLNQGTRMQNRHVDLILNQKLQQTLRMRFQLIQTLRNLLLNDNFVEVQTPLIADKASGAFARPFITSSAVISDKKLALRVAPELWLKRLIIGGFDRVFEIGSAFRNEGFDANHNPEFTTCEFYKAFTDLEELMSRTEELLLGLAKAAHYIREERLRTLPKVYIDNFRPPFKRINFIPAIEFALGESLPDLATEDAEENIINLFKRHKIPLIKSPTLPRLLDKLSAHFLEPMCIKPTFITHHPACMAPLAKSFLDPVSNQIVSARAELFANNKELANMYEEENSPIKQRSNFEKQGKFRDIENDGYVDESYLSALEWGLPPTGGWGCGIERLVMLLTGSERINEVLSFGSLKNVVNLGKASSS